MTQHDEQRAEEIRDWLDCLYIDVRQTNGQNAYGPWLPASHEDVPAWVGELAAEEIAENDVDSGEVERGGSAWLFRKSKID